MHFTSGTQAPPLSPFSLFVACVLCCSPRGPHEVCHDLHVHGGRFHSLTLDFDVRRGVFGDCRLILAKSIVLSTTILQTIAQQKQMSRVLR